MFAGFCVPEVLCSQGSRFPSPMFPGSDFPEASCVEGPIFYGSAFPRSYVTEVLVQSLSVIRICEFNPVVVKPITDVANIGPREHRTLGT